MLKLGALFVGNFDTMDIIGSAVTHQKHIDIKLFPGIWYKNVQKHYSYIIFMVF